MVTLIYPSRGRAQIAKENIEKWISRFVLPTDQLEIILSLDSDDPCLWEYSRKSSIVNFSVFINDNKSAIEAINLCAKFYSKHRGLPGDYLIVMSDDFDCPYDWGLRLSFLKDKKDWLLKVKDGIQSWIITLPIMDWVYYNRFGYVYHPDYLHAFSDTEMTFVGQMLGRIINSDIEFKHNHYSIGGLKDEISLRSEKHFGQGSQLFTKRINMNPPFELEGAVNPLPQVYPYSQMRIIR